MASLFSWLKSNKRKYQNSASINIVCPYQRNIFNVIESGRTPDWSLVKYGVNLGFMPSSYIVDYKVDSEFIKRVQGRSNKSSGTSGSGKRVL